MSSSVLSLYFLLGSFRGLSWLRDRRDRHRMGKPDPYRMSAQADQSALRSKRRQATGVGTILEMLQIVKTLGTSH